MRKEEEEEGNNRRRSTDSSSFSFLPPMCLRRDPLPSPPPLNSVASLPPFSFPSGHRGKRGGGGDGGGGGGGGRRPSLLSPPSGIEVRRRDSTS